MCHLEWKKQGYHGMDWQSLQRALTRWRRLLHVQDIKVADWSQEVAPFWGAVIKSALSTQGFSGLFKAGWTTIKASACVL